MDDTALALSIMGVLMICLMLFWHQHYSSQRGSRPPLTPSARRARRAARLIALCGLTCAATTIFLLITAHPINLGAFLLATAILVGALLAWVYLACYAWHLIEPRSAEDGASED